MDEEVATNPECRIDKEEEEPKEDPEEEPEKIFAMT